MINIIREKEEKKQIARHILEALPEWFEIPDAREEYILNSAEQVMFAVFDADSPIGFLCLKETGKDTMEIHVMGILKEYHRKGIGSLLLQKAKDFAKEKEYSFLQVKTVQMGKYPNYDKTNQFYLSQGFKELDVLPELWGETNPCQIYVMSI